MTSINNEEEEYKINPVLYQKAKDKLNKLNPIEKKELQGSISWFFLTDSIKRTTRESIQAKMKKYDIAALVLAFIGIVTNLLASGFYIDFKKEDYQGNIYYYII